MEKKYCPWAKTQLDIEYHNLYWGKSNHDDLSLFENLILESMQCGLSWSTILSKRAKMRNALDDFNPHVLKKYDDQKIQMLLKNPDVIRNKLKLQSLKDNAIAFLKIQKSFGSFDKYIWHFTDYEQIVNCFTDNKDVPTKTELSTIISNDMKKNGFKFFGPTITYAFMQAIGIVNDHLTWCDFR